MKCEEFKKILYESALDLQVVPELEAHAKACNKCQKLLQHEKALKTSFQDLIQTIEVSADLSKKISAIPQDEHQKPSVLVSLYKTLLSLISAVPIKTVLVSSAAGFILAALIFYNQAVRPTYESVHNDLLATIKEKTAPSEYAQAPLEELSSFSSPSGQIFGAHFSYDIDEDDFRTEQEETNLVLAKSFRGAVDLEVVSQQPPTVSKDPRAEEIEKIIEENNLKVDEGFIDLEKWAMQGYISSDKIISLRPTTGGRWYAEISEHKVTIKLKN